MADDIKLNADPTSTWGASEDYRAAWNEKYGNVTPAASASAAEWKKFATDKGGMSTDEAEGMTRDALVEHFGGGGVVYSAPAVASDTVPGQGAGTSAEGNVATDPAKTPGTPAGGAR